MMLSDLYQTLTASHTNRRFLIAFSGGLDSCVLLHALRELQKQDPDFILQAIHIHHGLHEQADHWEQHCQQICEQFGIPYQSHRIKLNPQSGESLEELARLARYDALAQYLQPNACLLTAHHQDDQAETLLLRLLRGSGPKGLSAMPLQQKFASGYLMRPFLALTRQHLQDYAEYHQLSWIEDPSNANLQFDRNYLRQQVTPLLRKRWSEFANNLARTANHCAESAGLLDELAQQDLADIKGDKENILLHEPLSRLSYARQNNVLRYWIRTLGYRAPSTRKLQQIHLDVLRSAYDKMPSISWGGAQLKRYAEKIILLPVVLNDNQSLNPNWNKIVWDLVSSLNLPNGLGHLSVYHRAGVGIRADIDKTKLTIRFRQGGERCRLAGRNCTHSLKKLFQQWRIPPWERDRIPLLYDGEQMVSIIGYAICEGYTIEKEAEGIIVVHYPD